jgi:transposase
MGLAGFVNYAQRAYFQRLTVLSGTSKSVEGTQRFGGPCWQVQIIDMQIGSVGIDPGKTTIHLVAHAQPRQPALERVEGSGAQVVAMNLEVEQIASSDPACQRLRQIPCIGPLVATAVVASIGNGAAFPKGPDFASRFGTCATTIFDRRQGQTLRHQQARQQLSEEAACAWCPIRCSPRQGEGSPFGPWLDGLERRSPVKVVITAAANKLARVASAVLSAT